MKPRATVVALVPLCFGCSDPSEDEITPIADPAEVPAGGKADGAASQENPNLIVWSGSFRSPGFVVPTDAVLVIEPGTEVRFSPGASLTVNGGLMSLGTEDAPVVLTAADTPWNGVTIDRFGRGYLGHTTVAYADIGVRARNDWNHADVIVEHSRIKHTRIGVQVAGGVAVISDSQIVDASEDGVVAAGHRTSPGSSVHRPGHVRIQYSEISDVGGAAVFADGTGGSNERVTIDAHDLRVRDTPVAFAAEYGAVVTAQNADLADATPTETRARLSWRKPRYDVTEGTTHRLPVTAAPAGLPADLVALPPALLGRPAAVSRFEVEAWQAPGYPHARPTKEALRVRWLDAIEIANARSQAEGLEPCYALDVGDTVHRVDDCLGYRLPTADEMFAIAAVAEPSFDAPRFDGPLDHLDPSVRGSLQCYRGCNAGSVDDWPFLDRQYVYGGGIWATTPSVTGVYGIAADQIEWLWSSWSSGEIVDDPSVSINDEAVLASYPEADGWLDGQRRRDGVQAFRLIRWLE